MTMEKITSAAAAERQPSRSRTRRPANTITITGSTGERSDGAVHGSIDFSVAREAAARPAGYYMSYTRVARVADNQRTDVRWNIQTPSNFVSL